MLALAAGLGTASSAQDSWDDATVFDAAQYRTDLQRVLASTDDLQQKLEVLEAATDAHMESGATRLKRKQEADKALGPSAAREARWGRFNFVWHTRNLYLAKATRTLIRPRINEIHALSEPHQRPAQRWRRLETLRKIEALFEDLEQGSMAALEDLGATPALLAEYERAVSDAQASAAGRDSPSATGEGTTPVGQVPAAANAKH